MTKLKQFAYEYEWRHSTTNSSINSMVVKKPRSKEHVMTMVGPVVVYDLLTTVPTIYFITNSMAVQFMGAIVAEIGRERDRLIKENDSAIRDK